MEYGRYVCDRWQVFDYASEAIRQSVGTAGRAAYAAAVAGIQFASDRRYLPHPMTAEPAPAPVREYPFPAGKRAPVSSGLPF